ncbi:MAG: DUF167 domain-containing protein [Candidatus Omnitrophica bacterium]|nr:DUF167 domain-containing protein [Candidatus Omnitrophota bacterium]
MKVKPNSKAEVVEKISDNEFVVRVNAPAKEGRANEAVIAALSGYFGIPKSRIRIAKGHASRIKIIELQ